MSKRSVFYDEIAIRKAARGAKNKAEIIERLGVPAKGGHYVQLDRAAERYGIKLPERRRARPPVGRQPWGKFSDDANVRAAVAGARSYSAACQSLGVAATGKNYDLLTVACGRLGIEPPPRGKQGRVRRDPVALALGNFAKFTPGQVQAVLATARSQRAVMLALGLTGHSSDYLGLASFAAIHGLDIPDGRGSAGRDRRPLIPLSVVLVAGRRTNSGRLRERLIREGILRNICSVCAMLPVWNGMPLTLELDHINGDPEDNRLENLRILCGHCHSQTATFRNKKRPESAAA